MRCNNVYHVRNTMSCWSHRRKLFLPSSLYSLRVCTWLPYPKITQSDLLRNAKRFHVYHTTHHPEVFKILELEVIQHCRSIFGFRLLFTMLCAAMYSGP
ncbi:hypothetical protein K474DRAFT_1480052 [Panus rudis PR-1116 ss-1]|nr:hypothetical protein K474DRAFT_1480052 [Panus rudis PR-1116 ss-1]